MSLSSILTSLHVPEKHSHSMMLPPQCFTVGMVLGKWWCWKIRPKSSILVSTNLIILLLIVWFLGTFLIVGTLGIFYWVKASVLFPPDQLDWLDDHIREESWFCQSSSVLERWKLLYSYETSTQQKRCRTLSRWSVNIDPKSWHRSSVK